MSAILWLKLKSMRQDAISYVIMTVMALVLTFVFGNASLGSGTLRLYVTDNDGSDLSAAFIGAFNADVYTIEQMEELDAQTAVAKGEALAAIVIPKDFADSVVRGEAAVTIIRTADSADVYALESAANAAYQSAAHVYKLHSELANMLSNVGVEVPSLETVQDVFENRMNDKTVTVSYTILDTDGYDERFAGNIHFMMGFNIFFVLFSIVFTMGSILEDKKLHTWNRIRISPLSANSVLAGHFIFAYVIGVLQMAIVLFLGQTLFGIDLGGARLPVFGVFAVFVLAAACLGLFLAVAFKTYEQLNAAVPVIIVATSMLGGCMWSISIVGPVLHAIAKVTPQYWAVDALENLCVYGDGISDVLLNIGVLFGMALVLFTVSMLIYNKKQRA